MLTWGQYKKGEKALDVVMRSFRYYPHGLNKHWVRSSSCCARPLQYSSWYTAWPPNNTCIWAQQPPDLCSDHPHTHTHTQPIHEESWCPHHPLPCHIKSHTLLTEVACPVLGCEATCKEASPETTKGEYLFVHCAYCIFVFCTACVTPLNLFLLIAQ